MVDHMKQAQKRVKWPHGEFSIVFKINVPSMVSIFRAHSPIIILNMQLLVPFQCPSLTTSHAIHYLKYKCPRLAYITYDHISLHNITYASMSGSHYSMEEAIRIPHIQHQRFLVELSHLIAENDKSEFGLADNGLWGQGGQ